jgi:LacI family transcriptional regulator
MPRNQANPGSDGGAPSIQDIADQLGLSKSTVSRSLANRPGPSARTRHRVTTAARKLGYEPNELAQSLTRGATMTIGFLVRDIASPALPPTLLGAESVLRSHGYAMLLLNSEGEAELDREHLRVLWRRRVDGLLLSLADEDDPKTHSELRRLPLPFVAVDRDLPGRLGNGAVKLDLATGLMHAADRFVTLGHTRFAFIGGAANIRPTKETLRVLDERLLARAGRVVHVETGAFSAEHGLDATLRALDTPVQPTALIAGNTQILRGVLAALANRGLRVPDDVSVMSIDDAPFLEFMTPAISVLTIDGPALGQTAAELILARLAGEPPETRTVPTSFCERDSLATASGRPARRRRAARR